MYKGCMAPLVVAILFITACGGGSGGGSDHDNAPGCTDQQARLEADMTSTLAAAADTDFTLLLERADGRSFRYSRGASTATTAYESASTSKLVTAVVILDLIARGTTTLTLDSRPSELIGAAHWPTIPAGDPAEGITLRHLLGFTSGFMTEPAPAAGDSLGCLNQPLGDIRSCVRAIYDTNIGNGITPGSQFYYSGTHLQIAGLMAVEAAGASDWNELFDAFKARTGLFAHSAYRLPSARNPRLAGGMVWTGEDYLQFLKALRSGSLLSASLQAELWTNQRGSARVVYSPVKIKLAEDWGYALGNWVECSSATYDCGTPQRRNSSPGAFGAYPFVDFEFGYSGIVARQEDSGSFPAGVQLFRSVQPTAESWAALRCP